MKGWANKIYWGVIGALIAIGLDGSWSFQNYFWWLAALLLIYGIARVRPRCFWALLIGFGILPAFFMLSTYVLMRHCPGNSVIIVPTDIKYTCGDVPTSYLYLGILFGLIALAGMIWGANEIRQAP